MPEVKLTAQTLRKRKYAIRPEGATGANGWIDGKPWSVFYVEARSEEEAIRKARVKGYFKKLEAE